MFARKRCCGAIVLGSIAIVLIIAGGAVFGMARRQENNFSESACLVLDAKIETRQCERAKTEDLYPQPIEPEKMKSVSGNNIKASSVCYLSIWSVEFNDTTITINGLPQHAQIEGPYQRKYNAVQKELDKYPINSTHKCYYDKRPSKNHVQWRKPNSTPGLICLLVGVGLTVLTLPLFIIFAIIKRRDRDESI